MKKKKIVVIGGGTGTVAVLFGLKRYEDLDLSVIVSMTDDGGSNAVIRDEFGLLPLSDLRKSIIALAPLVGAGNEVLRQIFTYRFSKGDGLAGHTLGNLIMMGLSEIKGGEVEAVDALSHVLQLKGRVIPVTLHHTNLVAEYDDGTQIASEHLIDESQEAHQKKIIRLSLTPEVSAYEPAIEAIQGADYIIAGPGDLYTTTLANIIVPGIAAAIQKNSGTFIFINNLMTKRGQTHWMQASDLVGEITRYAGRHPDIVVVHDGHFPPSVLEAYRQKGEHPIVTDIQTIQTCKIIHADVVGSGEIVPDRGGTLVRSLIRHDAEKLAKTLMAFMM